MPPHRRLPSNSCIGRAPHNFPNLPAHLLMGRIRYSTSVSGWLPVGRRSASLRWSISGDGRFSPDPPVGIKQYGKSWDMLETSGSTWGVGPAGGDDSVVSRSV